MGEWLKSVLPASAGFCLYRSAATFLYNSGMGMYQSSVGFVSDLSFVLTMNACACVFAAALLLLLRVGRLRGWCASPWVAFGLVLIGVLAGLLGPLAGPGAEAAGRFVAAALCGVALTVLSVAWIDFFVVQDDPARVLAQVVVGYTLYTGVTCFYALMSNAVAVAVSLVFLAASAAAATWLKRGGGRVAGPGRSVPVAKELLRAFHLRGLLCAGGRCGHHAHLGDRLVGRVRDRGAHVGHEGPVVGGVLADRGAHGSERELERSV